MADSFLRLLDPDPRIAQQPFDHLRRKLIFYFQRKNLSPKSEDLADETIFRVLKELREMGPAAVNERTEEDLTKFTSVVARNVASEGRRRRMWGADTEQFPEGVNGDEISSSREPDPEASFRAKERWELVQTCLRSLPMSDRELFVPYYLDESTVRDEMAQSQGLTIDGLRTRIHRIMNRVRECARTRASKQ
ncbi:MAG: sigma-70 family RNA polymerase sigma factor [Terracidiphilus sp.]|jgi:RNA polymerase sigma factor (sigma-70 family)